MSNYETYSSSVENKGRGRVVLLGLLLLVGLIVYNLKIDKKADALIADSDGGVIILGTQKNPFDKERVLWSAHYSSSGKVLWNRKYDLALSVNLWPMLEYQWMDGELKLTWPGLDASLDSKGRMLFDKKMEENSGSAGDLRNTIVLANGQIYAIEGMEIISTLDDEILWVSSFAKRFHETGIKPQNPALFIDENENIRLVVTLEDDRGELIRRSMVLNHKGQWDRSSIRSETITGGVLYPQEGSYYSPVSQEIQNGAFHYELRKGRLEMLDFENTGKKGSWEKQVYWPIMDMLEDYF